MSELQPTTEPGEGTTSSEFLESSLDWAIAHLGEARHWLKAGDEAQFRCAIRKFGACARAMLDTVPEVKL